MNEPRQTTAVPEGSGDWGPQASWQGYAVTALGGWSTQETDQCGQMTWFLKTGRNPEIKEQNNLGQIDKTCEVEPGPSVSPLATREKVHRRWNLKLFLVWSGLLPKPHQFPLLLVLSLPVTQQTRRLVESTGSTASHLAQILTVT